MSDIAIAMPKYKGGLPGNNAVKKGFDSTALYAQNQLYVTEGSGASAGAGANAEPLETRRRSKNQLAGMGIGFYRYSIRNTAQDMTLNWYYSIDSGDSWVLIPAAALVLAAASTPTEGTIDIRAYPDFKIEVTAGATGPTLFDWQQALMDFSTGS